MLSPAWMEIKKFELRELMTYSYCPMQWWLRYQLELPWFSVTPETLFSRLSRQAFTEYFRMESAAVTSRKSAEAAVRIVEEGTAQAKIVWPHHAGLLQKLYLETLLAFRDLRSYYAQGRDTIIGCPIPYETAITRGENLIVSSDVDLVLMTRDRTAMKNLLVITVVSSKDPHEDLVPWSQARVGWTQYAVRKGLGQHYEIPLLMLAFPIVKRQPPIRSKAKHGVAFENVAKQTAKGIRAQYVMPTAHPARCQHCPYNSICSVDLALVSPRSKGNEIMREILEKEHRDNPFRESK